MALSKAMECPVCFEVCASNVIICKSGHGACQECARTLRGRPCHTCRGPLIRDFIPNRPLDGTATPFQTMEAELTNVKAELHHERTAHEGLQLEFAQFKSHYEELMKDIESQMPDRKRRRASEVGEPSGSAPPLVGKTIQICGLITRPDLNGQYGTLQGPYGSTGRLVVRLEGGHLVALTRAAVERCIELVE